MAGVHPKIKRNDGILIPKYTTNDGILIPKYTTNDGILIPKYTTNDGILMNEDTQCEEGNKLTNIIWVIAGTISLAFGIIGIVLPLLPTTPFLLLSAACYCRGSEKMHTWLLEHKLFGRYIRDYQEKRGIRKKAKITAIVTMWASILLCAWYLGYSEIMPDKILYVQILLIIIASGVTIHLLKLKTL